MSRSPVAFPRIVARSVRLVALAAPLLAAVIVLGLALTGLPTPPPAAAASDADAILVAFTDALNATVADAGGLLAGLAERPEVKGGDPAACSTFLAGVQFGLPRYQSMGRTAADGNIVCSAVPISSTISISDRAYVKAAMESGTLAISGYVIGRTSGRPTINFASPLAGVAGRPAGVLFAGLDLEWLNKSVLEVPLPDGAVLLAADSEGTILVRRPDARRWVGEKGPEGSIVPLMLEQRQGGASVVGEDGVVRSYTFAPLGAGLMAGTLLAVGMPE